MESLAREAKRFIARPTRFIRGGAIDEARRGA
jgi:hypothetical protein